MDNKLQMHESSMPLLVEFGLAKTTTSVSKDACEHITVLLVYGFNQLRKAMNNKIVTDLSKACLPDKMGSLLFCCLIRCR